jgi:hypothetical protein
MKDLEQIIPFLREFLNERGLKDVKIEVTLSNLEIKVLNETHSDYAAKETGSIAGGKLYKPVHKEDGDLNLFSKYF